MIGGAAERDGQIERAQSGIDEFEQGGVFDREHEGEPVVAGVGDFQSSLQSVERRLGGEARGRLAQLIGGGLVLGVIDREQFAARRLERDVARPRLRSGGSGGRNDDLVARRQAQSDEGRQRFLVAAFDSQLNVELCLGIVAALGSKLT